MSAFIEELKEIIAKKHLLNHPFYQAWNKGELPIEVMQEYAKQYYHLEKNFPVFLSQMHAASGDNFDARRVITQNLHDEEGGTETHRELWLKYGEGIGVDRTEIENAEMISETEAAVSTFNELSHDYLLGSAALAAYEDQIPEVATSKVKGLEDHYDISDNETTKFFRVHEVADVAHAAAWWDIIDGHANTEEEKDAVRKAVTKGRDALWSFLDGIMREYMPSHAC